MCLLVKYEQNLYQYVIVTLLMLSWRCLTFLVQSYQNYDN